MMDLMERKATGVDSSDGRLNAGATGSAPAVLVASSEVTKPRRRVFTVPYKLRILREADGCRKPGELGALLRREGLYSSHLTKWRQQREEGTLSRGTIRRGPLPDPDKRVARENEKLSRELARVTRKLKRAELIIEYQKKVAELMGLPLEEAEASDTEAS